MREHTDVIVNHLQSHAVIGTEEIERHVAREVHRAGIVLEAYHRHVVAYDGIDFVLLAGCGRVIGSPHRPVMTERWVILRHHSEGTAEKQGQYR